MVARLLLFLLLIAPCSAESILAYSRRNKCLIYYGIYMLGSKVGWMSVREENTKVAGRELHLVESVRYIERRSGLFGGRSVNRVTSREYYELAGEGRLFTANLKQETDGRQAVSTLERKGAAFWLQRPGQAGFKVAAPRHTLRDSQHMERWVRSAKAGQQHVLWTISLEQDPLERPIHFKFLARQSIVWGGVPTAAYQLEFQEEGLTGKAVVRSDGQLWKLEGGPMEMRVEPKAVAQKLDSNVDMLAAASIKVNKNLGHPSKISRLRLKIEGLGNFRIPQSPRQKLEGQNLLVLRRDRPEGPAEPLSAAERKRFLASTDSIIVNERMRKLSRAILGGGKGDALARAAQLQHWVYEKLDKTYSKNASNALQVLENEAGDCTEHTVLFVSLARSAGIPAREVGGLMYVPGLVGDGTFGWHAWPEIYTGRRWVGVDPTFDENLIDATHIKMTRSAKDMSWLQVMGKLRLTVLD